MALIRFLFLAIALLGAAPSADAAISLRVSASAGGTANGGIALNRLDGTGEGDLMVVALTVENRSAAQVTDPVGWTRALATDNSNHTQLVVYRFASAADVSGASPAWTWTWAGNRRYVASRLVLRGVATAGTVNISAAAAYVNNSATVTVPSVTPSVAGTMLLAVGTINRGTTFAWTGPMAEATDNQSGGGGADVSHSTALEAGPGAGVATGTRTVTAAGADNRRSAQMIAFAPAVVPGPVLHWRFDEGAWNGTAGEVKDWSGNNLHGFAAGAVGTASTTAANNGSPAYCRSGLFNSANSQYVETASTGLLNITDRLTITAWVRPYTLPGAGLMTIASKDTNYEFHLTPTGAVNWWWTAGANQITTAGGVAPVNTWTHVAIVYSRGAQEIYVNGALSANNWTNPDRNLLVTNGLPFHAGDDQGTLGRYFNGQIDEVRIYNYAMSAADVLAVRNDVPSPLCPPDHISITPSGGASASTCLAKPLTFTVQDVNNVTVTSYTGTMNLATSTSRGDWSNGDGVNVPGNGVANDGAASHLFAAGDLGDVQLNLTNQSQDDLAVTATDSLWNWVTGTSITVNFRDNAFIFSEDLSGLVAGADIVVAGRPHDIRATYIYRDAVTTNCGTLTSYTGAKSIKAWITRAGTDPGGMAPQIGATALPNAAPGGNNLAITFTAGVANFNLATSDVGKYALNFRDDAPGVANTAVSGASGELTVRPFTIAVSGIRQGATGNPGSNTPAGALFAAAGTNFEMTLGAYRHSAAADADNNGVPDGGATFAQVSANGVAPAFAATANFSAVAPFTPAAGGSLGNGAVAMTAGSANPANLTFSEVGSFTLSTAAVVPSYLGTAGLDLPATVYNAAGTQVTPAPVVGRFRPDHFFISTSARTNRSAAACAPASSFTYMDEGLATSFTLQARNAANAVTANYTTASGYAKLDPGTIAQLGYGAVNASVTPTNLTPRLDLSLGSAGSFVAGQAAVSATIAVRRPTPDNPDGPFDLAKVGVAPNDGEGTTLRTADMNMDVDGVGGNDRVQLGPDTRIRFGRLRLLNAAGSLMTLLPVPLRTEYWNGTLFALNTQDSCTTVARNTLAMSFTPASNLVACETAFTAASATMASGLATLYLAAPGAGNTGSVLLTPQLYPPAAGTFCATVGGAAAATTPANQGYLTGRWIDPPNPGADPDANPNTSHDDNPSGRASFGIYGSQPNNYIYFRENY